MQVNQGAEGSLMARHLIVVYFGTRTVLAAASPGSAVGGLQRGNSPSRVVNPGFGVENQVTGPNQGCCLQHPSWTPGKAVLGVWTGH